LAGQLPDNSESDGCCGDADVLHPTALRFALSGVEFDALSSEQQVAASKSLAVFARVEPLHKLKLVELLRAQVPTCTTHRLIDICITTCSRLGMCLLDVTFDQTHILALHVQSTSDKTIRPSGRQGAAS
jgi:hypothetical protein